MVAVLVPTVERSFDADSMKPRRPYREGEPILTTQQPAESVDRKIVGLRGGSHDQWMTEALSSINDLEKKVQELRLDERYFRKLTETVKPSLDLLQHHADALSGAVSEYGAKLGKQPSELCESNESNGKPRKTLRSWGQKCMGLPRAGNGR